MEADPRKNPITVRITADGKPGLGSVQITDADTGRPINNCTRIDYEPLDGYHCRFTVRLTLVDVQADIRAQATLATEMPMPDDVGPAASDALPNSVRPVTTDHAATLCPVSRICAADHDDGTTGFSAGASVMACTAAELERQAMEIARVGDILLFDRSQATAESRTWKVLRWGIARAQSRMLADYGICRDNVADGARFVHAALLGDAGSFAEMDSVCQLRQLQDVPPGTIIRIRRPLGVDGQDAPAVIGDGAWQSALEDVRESVRYPTGELLMYYGWSWGLNKLLLGRSFCNVFRTDRANTCAAAAVAWWQIQAGNWFSAERAEAWYPGRVAVSGSLRTVCEVRISP